MAPYHNVMVLLLASLLLTSVICDSPVSSPSPSPVEPQAPTPSPVEQAPSPSPVEPRAPTPSPVEPQAPAPATSIAPAPSPVETPSLSPSGAPSSMPPGEAPAPESSAGLNRVSVGLGCIGAFLVAFMA